MRRHIKKYLIPCIENDHKPCLLHKGPVVVMTFIIVGFFALSTIAQFVLLKNSSSLAAVISSALIELTNDDREDFNLNPLSQNPILTYAAQLKANDMAQKGYFAHTSPDGTTPWHWFKEAGYTFSYAGENLAVNFSDSNQVERAWMNSDSHRANILNDNFTEIGIATAEGVYKGRSTTYVVQFFGKPGRVLAETTDVPDTTQTESPTETGSVPAEQEGEELAVLASEKTNEELEVLSQDNEFVAVRNNNTEPVETISVASVQKQPALVSFLTELVSSPKTTLGYVYLILGGLIALTLALMVLVEWRREHATHMVYALSLLLLIGVLYLGQGMILPEVLIHG